MARRKKYLSASEIGSYVYCRRSWWLQSVQGEKSRNVRELAAGTEFHEEHGRTLGFAVFVRRVAYVLLVACILLAIYWVVTGG